jgi:hypothetical protein
VVPERPRRAPGKSHGDDGEGNPTNPIGPITSGAMAHRHGRWDTPTWALILIGAGLVAFIILLPLALSRGVVSEAPRAQSGAMTSALPTDLSRARVMPPPAAPPKDTALTPQAQEVARPPEELAAASPSSRFAGANVAGGWATRARSAPAGSMGA